MTERAPAAPRYGLGLLAVSAAVVGWWATLAPRSFYDDFPGASRHWVAADGPFNEHLVRDVGTLNLALAAVTAFAALRFTTTVARLVSAAWLVYSVPHLAYHLAHLDTLAATGDKVALVATLALTVLVPGYVLARLYRPSPSGRAKPAA